MGTLLAILFIFIIVQLSFSILFRFPALGLLLYGLFLFYAWWKMKQLSHRTKPKQTRPFAQDCLNKTAKSNHIIDVEYTEREIKEH